MRLIFPRVGYSQTAERELWGDTRRSIRANIPASASNFCRMTYRDADFSTISARRRTLKSIVWHARSKNIPAVFCLDISFSLCILAANSTSRTKHKKMFTRRHSNFRGNLLLVILATVVTSLRKDEHAHTTSTATLRRRRSGTNNGKCPSVDSELRKRVLA